MALLWLLLQCKTPSQDQICIKAKERSVCKKSIRMLQRKMLAKRARVEMAVTGKGWGCEALQPPQLARGVTGFSLFHFCGLCCCLLQCTPLQFVWILFVFCDGICSVFGLVVLYFLWDNRR